MHRLPPRTQRLDPGPILRHRHIDGYVALVLAGSYEEVGACGRRTLTAGDFVVHHPYEAHANRVSPHGAVIANLRLRGLAAGYYRMPNRAAESVAMNEPSALLPLLRTADPLPVSSDWPDLLAADLRADPTTIIEEWASRHGVRFGDLARSFRSVFGVSPKRFRAEMKALRAIGIIRTTGAPLADVAIDAGFCDQAHLTNAVRALAGKTPLGLRESARAGSSGVA